MYPRPFHYHRAASVKEAVSLLAELGEEAKLLAGGQSLIPLMKLRLASPAHLVDLNFVPGLSYSRKEDGVIRLGALTRHCEVAASPVAAQVPILHDCADGIADVQVRNRGTVVQLTLGDNDTCKEAGIALGAVGLTAIKAKEAEATLRGQRLTDKTLEAAAEAAMAAADPQPDMRGSAAYKRALVGVLLKRAIKVALRRARGEQVEVSHYYA
jgi:CO/xanthine dehydrogenase FAD-binding subunit